MLDATALGIREVCLRIRSGRFAAVELMRECLDAVDNLDGKLNVFAAKSKRDLLLSQAAAVDSKCKAGVAVGLLEGVPIALKDIYLTSDLPTTASSKILAGFQSEEDAQAVKLLKQAGALVMGKAQTHEFAYGPTTINEFAGPSRNPWNPDHVPGGSSGGSAIAVATGMCLAATGSDTGGSIRHPSAFCGVSGLKPTYGLVSRRGILPLSWSLDHAGPIARSADDLAFMLQAMAGFDPQDPGSALVDIPDYVGGIGRSPDTFRIGIPREYYCEALDSEVEHGFEQSVDILKRFGWSVEEVSIPHLRYALGAELAILSAEASSYHRDTMLDRADDISSNVRRELDAGMVVLATDYLLGQRVRRIIIDEFATVLRKVDLLVTPTVPITAPRIDQTEVELGGRNVSVLNAIWRNAFPTNLTGSPTLCLPCGFSRSGLPLSLQLIGRNFDELALLQAGHKYQLETDWHRRTPPLTLNRPIP
jgi:aspartyl-tRNA(Asn)/glutamyl-tRNA(Gln) amidotransferase subunit A